MRAVATALLVLLLVAPAFTQEPPKIDQALLAQFVSADAAGRDALIKARPEIIERAFREFVLSEGTRLRQTGDFEHAEQHLRAAIYIGDRHNVPALAATAYAGLVQMASLSRDQTHARELAEEALRLATRSGDRASLQQAYASLAIIQRRMGELDASLATQQRALDLARELKDALATARALHNIGLVTQNLGNSAKALEYYVESLAIKTSNQAPANDLVVTLTSIGTIYAEQNEYDLAASYYQRAIDSGGATMTANLAGAYNNLGQTQIAMGQLEAAKKTFAKALPWAQQTRNQSAEATMVYNLGVIARSEDRFVEAEDLQRKSLALRESSGEAMGLAESLTEVSNLLTRLGRSDEALPYGERAVSIAANSRFLNQLWKAQLTTGQAYAALGRDNEARSLYEGAIQTIETLRALAAGGNSGQRIMMGRLGPFYGLAALELRAGRTFEALTIIDRGRARALIDVLTTDRAPARRLSVEQRARERELTESVRRSAALADTELRKPEPDRAKLAALDADVAASRLKREAFLGEMYAQQPDLRLARGHTPDFTNAQLMALLTPGTAIVSYALDDKSSWAYVTTKGADGPVVTVHQLPLQTDAVMSLADKFTRQVSSRDLGFATTARSAYDALLGAAAPRLAGATRLIIIPDGPLWRVPFQALRTPKGRFLVEDAAVSYTPSIAALVALEERRRSRPASAPYLVALGNPSAATPTAASTTGNSLRGVTPVRLPEAAREVRSLGQLYGAAHSAVLVDSAATEGALRAQSTRATVLHVATHGVLDNFNPMYSHLLLAPSQAGAVTDDGRLEAWELLDMNINADVAVLSACQTARGGPGFGEGIMGLSWSLFASGASTAVVSQWEVDSASTTSLMIGFHRRLLAAGKNGAGSPEALRLSAVALMKDPNYRHPFYWAGFIAVGAR